MWLGCECEMEILEWIRSIMFSPQESRSVRAKGHISNLLSMSLYKISNNTLHTARFYVLYSFPLTNTWVQKCSESFECLNLNERCAFLVGAQGLLNFWSIKAERVMGWMLSIMTHWQTIDIWHFACAVT